MKVLAEISSIEVKAIEHAGRDHVMEIVCEWSLIDFGGDSPIVLDCDVPNLHAIRRPPQDQLVHR